MTKLFTVGPITMRESVLEEGAKQPPYFRDPSYGEMAKTIIVDLLALMKAPEGSQLATLTGSGTAGMEAAVINLFDENSKVLVIDGGSFGRRFQEICEGYGIPHEVVKIAPGTDLKREHLDAYEAFDGILVNMHETSTGQLYDIDMLGKLCAEKDALLVCDIISSFLADPYDMAAMGANVSLLSTNKGLGLAPGLALVALDPKAASRLKRPKSLYFRLEDYLVNAKRGQTPYTPAISVMLQLRKRLDEIKAAGGYDAIVEQVRAQAMDYLKNGGVVALFPSGVVSSSDTMFGPVIEREWNVFTAQLIRRSGARVVPIYFPGENTRWYQIANRISAVLRQGLLLREIVKSCNKPQGPVIGKPLTDEQMEELQRNPRGFMAWLRNYTLTLSKNPNAV